MIGDDPATRSSVPARSTLPLANLRRHAAGSDTMRAWERFLTGEKLAVMPAQNFVVASWLRSQQHGIDPTGRAAPLAARGDAIEQLRQRHDPMLTAAAPIFTEAADLLDGSRSMMLLTDPDGVVLETVGDGQTLDQGQGIHLMAGGDWREATIGTNGIGTAIATGRPAQVHAAEHFCEGIKAWTCAAAPILDPASGQVMGVVDISGPPETFQRNNLALAIATARQIEAMLAERTAQERMRLLELCLERLSSADAAGMIAIDRGGRLVHSSGRVGASLGVPLGTIGARLAGCEAGVAVEDWARRLPDGLRPEWFNPVVVDGRAIGAMLIIPTRSAGPAAITSAAPPAGSETDRGRSAFAHIIGRGPAMAEAIERARRLVGKRVPVLIDGETGVGKELFARAMHGEEDERKPFVVFNCGAVAKDLLASELFGYVRGAYTGATAEGRPGRFELAHGGTLCLDEIGELPLDLQPFLLRALEEGVVYRLGSGQPRRVDVRLLAMTNRTLLDEVAAGRFRRDLYYRIGVTRVRIPPLRERGEDVVALVEHFRLSLAERHGVPARRFGASALSVLRAHAWPGNVRELRNLVESVLLMPPENAAEVSPAELAALIPELNEPAAPGPRPPAASLVAAERGAIAQAVRSSHGNLAGAARSLGISRSTLYRKMERYGLHV